MDAWICNFNSAADTLGIGEKAAAALASAATGGNATSPGSDYATFDLLGVSFMVNKLMCTSNLFWTFDGNLPGVHRPNPVDVTLTCIRLKWHFDLVKRF